MLSVSIDLGGAAQRFIGTGEIDIAGAARRHLRFIHGGERRAHEQQEAVAGGLEEDVELHIAGNSHAQAHQTRPQP